MATNPSALPIVWPPLVGTSVTLLAEGPAASTTLGNTRALQTALSAGGDILLTEPGTYEFDVTDGPMTLPSNTSLYVGTGVTLKVADGSPSALFTNATARSTPVTMAGANVTYGTAPDGSNYCAIVTNMAAADAALFPVNSWVSVVTLGHGALGIAGTAAQGRGYRGVWKVVEQTINGARSGIKYEIDYYYPGSANPTADVLLYQANENVSIWGPGTIDGNGENADQDYNTGDPRGVVVWWRHVRTAVLSGLDWRRGATWAIGTNYVRGFFARNMTCELNRDAPFAAVDFIHLSGYNRTVRIEDNSGSSGDNFVGMTIDCTEGTAYDFPYQHPGDTYDIKIFRQTANCYTAESPGAFGIVGIYGPAAYKHFDIEVVSTAGQGSAGVQLAVYAPTNQNLVTIGRLLIRDQSTNANTQIEFTAGVYAIDTFIAERVTLVSELNRGIRIPSTATGTIREFVVNNMCLSPTDGTTYTRTVPFVNMGGLTINNFSMRGTEGVLQAINTHVVTRDGDGTIGKISFVDVSATGSGTGAATAALWQNTGDASVPTIQYTRCRSNGSAL